VNATIVKSDLDTSDPFWTSLREHVRSLENVPDRLKDWHPGSDGLVLDLLHPSLYPLQYGKSRVLPTGSVPLRNCVEHTGLGEVCLVPSFSINETHSGYYKRKANGNEFHLDAWGYYQWLPSEISFGEDGSAKVDSYINNLHPERHAELHDVLATAVDKAVPLWNECLSWFHERLRLPVAGCSYEDFVAPTYPGYSHEDNDDNDDEDMDGEHESIDEYDKEQHYRDWMQAHPEERLLKQPSPHGDYVPFEQRLQTNGSRRIDLRSGFRDGLQVIFKLANIHLTPEKPVYSGSNWHVEGALNEHICATALFYYDSDNITDSYLEFRQEVDSMDMTCKPSQYEWEAAEAMFGIQNEGSAIQGLGRVLTRPGRLLAFPNVLQHKVGQFGLKDATKAGHRKILAMFLVDPHIQILSTANVPPQRVDWWAVEVQKVPPFSDLPVELFDRIMEHVEDFPISWDEACEMREELMAERGRANEDLDEMLREVCPSSEEAFRGVACNVCRTDQLVV